MEWTPNSAAQFSTLFAHECLLVTERYDAAPPARHLWSLCGKPSVTVVFKISFTTIRHHLLQFVKNQILTVIQFFSLNLKTKWFKTKTRLSSAEVTKSSLFFSSPLWIISWECETQIQKLCIYHTQNRPKAYFSHSNTYKRVYEKHTRFYQKFSCKMLPKAHFSISTKVAIIMQFPNLWILFVLLFHYIACYFAHNAFVLYPCKGYIQYKA